jgi:hypothetical protein
MSSTVTVTGVIGPAQAVTAQVFQNVTSFDIDCTNQLVKINQGTNPTTIISITGKSTLTLTQSNNNYTLSIS